MNTPGAVRAHAAAIESTARTDGPCTVCGKLPATKNNASSECSHVDCPTRRRAWSERLSRRELYAGPWATNTDEDPKPLDEVIK
jgi:hypothetical protein